MHKLSRGGSKLSLETTLGHALSKHADSCIYLAPDYWCVYRVARILRLKADDVFFDLGSGMGRILCVLARRNIRKCVGIELYEELCDMARSNALWLRGRKVPIEVRCGDAAVADLNEGTIYFMYNPFGADTLRDVLENIRKSLLSFPRSIRIVYYNSVHESVFRTCEWLERSEAFHTFTGRTVTFWKNREH
jgi:precorrin-6B methylase 2